MAEQPWVAFYFGDYLADTGALSLAEHGAYLLLLAETYKRGGALPCSEAPNAHGRHRPLYRLCRCEDETERAAVDAVLGAFFYLDTPTTYRHERVEKEIARTAERSRKAAASAAERWRRERGADVRPAPAMPEACESDAIASPPQPPEIANGVRPACSGDASTATVTATATTLPAKPFSTTPRARVTAGADGQVRTGPSQKTLQAVAWAVDNRGSSTAKVRDMLSQDPALARALDMLGGWGKWAAIEQNSPEDLAARGALMRAFGAACAERKEATK